MSNIEVLSAVHGIAPRSDALHRLGTDLERGRVSQAAFDEQITQETADWLQLQADAGVQIQSDGKLRWQDHLRPIVKASRGFAPDIDNATLTRWYEDNRFYRQPTINGYLELEDDGLAREIGTGNEHVSLLAPSTFASLCQNDSEIPESLNVRNLYTQLLFGLQHTAGVKRITLLDYLTDSSDLLGTDIALQDVEKLSTAQPDIQFSLLSPRSRDSAIPLNPQKNHGVQVRPSTVRHLTTHIPPQGRPKLRGSEIWQSVIDSRQTAIQEYPYGDADVTGLSILEPARVVITHTVDLELLPLPHAQQKVRQLGEWAYRLNEQLGARS